MVANKWSLSAPEQVTSLHTAAARLSQGRPLDVAAASLFSSAKAPRALLSAHRAAAAQSGNVENSLEALVHAVQMPVDFVELDVHRTADGKFILNHDAHVSTASGEKAIASLTAEQTEAALGRKVVSFEKALELIAKANKKAHIDFKFTSPAENYESPSDTFEVQATQIALEKMGSESEFIITTNEDESVSAVRAWCASSPLKVGLSLGRHPKGLGLRKNISTRFSEVRPAARIKACDANLVVVHHLLASLNVLRWSARQGLPVLVWTVDNPRVLNKFLDDPRVWLVTSNYPERSFDWPWRLSPRATS